MVLIASSPPCITPFHPRITQSLLDCISGCSEDGVHHHLLSRHQLVCVRLRVPAERKGGVALLESGLRGFGINLLLGRQETGQAVAELMKPEPLYSFSGQSTFRSFGTPSERLP